MGSVLDLLDTPDGLASLLGTAFTPSQPQQPPQPPQPPPQPPPQVMANAGAQFAPNSVVGGGGLNPPQSMATAPNPAPAMPNLAPHIAAPPLRDPMPTGQVGGEAASLGLGSAPGGAEDAAPQPQSQLYPQPVGPTRSPLAEARARLGDQIRNNPELRDKLFAYTMAEAGDRHGVGSQQTFMEEVLNQAAARNMDLSQVLGSNYFPFITHARARGGVTEAQRDALMPALDRVLGGSNVGKLATGNASWDPTRGRFVGFAGGPMTTSFGSGLTQERYGIEGKDLPWARSMAGAQQVYGEPAETPPPGGPGATGGVMGGGLASALGLPANALAALGQQPGDPRSHPFESAMASLGKGLTAVGNMRPGTSGAGAFAAGAGGALTGGAEASRTRRNDLFNQSSTAFKDMIAAQRADDASALSDAHARYWDAISKVGPDGKRISNVWSGTPQFMAFQIERQLDNLREARRKEWNDTLKFMTGNGSTMDEMKTEKKKFDDETEQKLQSERSRRSKALGVPENEYLRGTSKDNAFDFERLTPQQRLQMPDESWFKFKDPKNPKADKDGYVYHRRQYLKKPPFPGWEPGQSPTPPQQAPVPPPGSPAYPQAPAQTAEAEEVGSDE